MSKPVTIIVPSYCPDETVRGYEARCLKAVADHTPRGLYDLILMGGGDWSFPQKVNAAMTGVRTEFAVVLSNDVFVGPGWLPMLLSEYHVPKPACGIMSPQDHPVENGTLSFDDHWWGAPLISKKVWDEVGPLDETLPKVYHDQDWSIRAKHAGFEICRTGLVVVEHIGSATRWRVGTMDDAAERSEMIRRYGCAELHDYVRLYENRISK